MMHVLRDDPRYPFVIGLRREDGQPMTRIDTGLSLEWHRNDLALIVTPDELTALLDDLRETVQRESAAPEGDAA